MTLRTYASVDLVLAAPDRLAAALERRGLAGQARAVRDAAAAFGGLGEDDHYVDAVRLLEPAYLRATTPEAGSGFGGTAAQWRASRELIVDGIDRDGTFLDVGCANGLLMESVQQWAAERGHRIEPYGIDLGPRLVAAAQARLPHWTDRIAVGNAVNHRPAGGQRFTFVHVIVDLVPADRLADLLRHALAVLVEPRGRLLVSRYTPAGGTDQTSAADIVRRLGFTIAGTSSAETSSETGTTAWIDAT
jgi:SAM-dependent methyltransferase